MDTFSMSELSMLSADRIGGKIDHIVLGEYSEFTNPQKQGRRLSISWYWRRSEAFVAVDV